MRDSGIRTLFLVFLNVVVALVAADNNVINMVRKHDRQLDELMKDDDLLLPRQNRKEEEPLSKASTTAQPTPLTEHPLHAEQRKLFQDEDLLPALKNMSQWYKNEKSRFFERGTPAPPVGLTPHPLLLEEQLLLEEDDLLPTDFLSELSRDKRSVIGSGDLDTQVVATVTLVEAYKVANANEAKRKNDVALQLKQWFLDFNVEVDTVIVSNIIDDDRNAKYNFTVTFTGSTDRNGVAYALERLWRSEMLLGDYEAAKSPTVCNSADVVVNAICLLCVASRPCTAGVCQEFPTTASSTRVDFGIGEADMKLERKDDVISSAVKIPGGMPFFNGIVNNLYVGDNGGVSLDSPYNPYYISGIGAAIRNYLCIYCDDFDNRYPDGDVWYQDYPAGKVWATNMLARIASEVRANTEYKTFTAAWACVITWSNMPEYRSHANILPGSNSFQMIIAKDGQRTFMLFYYINDGASLYFREFGVHGYKGLGANSDVYEMLYSAQQLGPKQFNFDKPLMNNVKGNTGVAGKWIFKIGERTPNFAAMCFNWYLNNLPFRDNIRRRARLLNFNSCPCWRNVFFMSAAFLPASFNAQAPFCSEQQSWFFGGIDTHECCYDSIGRFISRYPEAGGYHRYSSIFDPRRHKAQDTDPKDWCCQKSNLCGLYQDVRPVSTCSFNRPIIIFIFNVGDPHYKTLDGKTLTFNGIGEYRLLELKAADDSFEFKVQCRTTQAVSSTGEKVKASVFSAFAAEQMSDSLGNGTVHVELNKDKNKMVIYFDDIDVTNEFYGDVNFVRRLPFLTASKKSDTRIEFAFTKTNIIMAVRLTSGALSQAIIIPETYRGLTKGLLGNYNGDPNDDFVTPTGQTYPSSSTDRQLFPYGKTWAIPNDGSSILHYAPGDSTTTFIDESFIPMFTDEITPAQRAAATVVCGIGKEECIYDYVVTKNQELAKATSAQLEEAENNNKLLANRAPTLTGTTQLNVEVGKSSPVVFIGNDTDSGDTVTYIAVEKPGSGFTFDQTTGTGVFTPENSNSVKIRVAAKDTKDAESPVVDVQIRLCKGCGDNGKCDYNTPETAIASQTDSLFKVVTCICNTGYTGADCSQDRKGCEGDPCGTGRTCTDNTPAQEVAGSRPYTCSDCLDGYQAPNPDAKCENVDECSTNNGSCPAHSTCEDTIGSYKCNCDTGFRKNSADTCDDIDECVEHVSDCAQTCTNAAGGFTCGCHLGFTLNADNKTCNADNVPAGCPSTCNSATELCVDDGTGNATCKCKAGYEIKTGETQCTDIDECKLSLCAQKCVNTAGSYTCSCYAGFILAPDNQDCLQCSFPKWGDNCASTCECQGRASSCDPVHGCVCKSGWTGTNCTSDVDECSTDPTICGSNSRCDNNPGSYTCVCNDGYGKNGTDCIDINECEEDNGELICPSNSACTNTLGSYVCSCNTGYRMVGSTCEDIDECATGQAACEHNCLNRNGSYNCYCTAGYSLNDDRKTCTKDPAKTDPCKGLTNTVCGHYCDVVSNQAVCKCNRGYYLAADNVTCLDVDECSVNGLNLCQDQSSCTNTPGSYTCACPVGQKLEHDGRNCADCDGTHWGNSCSNECACSDLGTETCDKIKGCVCKAGWTGTTCASDLDECSTQQCPANSDCVNTQGSFKCTCRTGYKKSTDGNSCNQIDECARDADNVCDQNCVDTPGSYYCACRAGFILSGMGTCEDIDECAVGSHDCQQLCRNTVGSFTCQCRDGFQFTDGSRKTCTVEPGSPTCNKTCNTTNGGCLDAAADTCFCNAGYVLNADGFTCDDIDECNQTSQCSGNCENSPGSFTCSCDPGFKLAMDKTTCKACEPGKYGADCASNCTCDTTNTASCNPVNGTCTCRSGWKGATCTEDIPECTDTDICGTNGICNEKPGSYSCTCVAGFIRANGACTACTSTKWGENCANTCSCDFTKTESCNAVSGQCKCNPQWKGINCTTDVDECTTIPPSVCTGDHQTCSNTQGSFDCGCTTGYQKSANNTVCIDLNECLSSTLNNCKYLCDNREGTFMCYCPAGYLGSGNDCKENFATFEIIITLDVDRSATVANPSSAAYKKLQDDIRIAIDIIIKPEVGDAHLKSIVKTLSTGSLVAPAELRFDKTKTDNDLGLLAKALEELAEIRSLSLDGNTTLVTNITYKSIPITKVQTVCDVYKIVRNFSNEEFCEVDSNGTPVAKKVTEKGDNVPLIVGLSVGALVLLILLVIAILYLCCYRKRSTKTSSEGRENNAFRSAFVGNLPMKGSFGASRYMMYSPHTLSDAASQASEDSSGRDRRERRGRKFGTNDFSDLPKWNDSPELTARGTTGRHEPTSNFSWENLFNRLGPFEVPRPAVSTTRNKFHTSLA